MTIEFNCPSCGKLLKTSDDKAGVQAKCPDCGEPIQVPEPAESSVEPGRGEFDFGEEDDYQSQFGGAPPQSSGETKPCPMCGEQIKAAAIRCRYCGEDLGGEALSGSTGREMYAAGKVNAPAISLIVVAGIGIAMQLLGVVANILNVMGMVPVAPIGPQNFQFMIQGEVGLVFNVIVIAIGVAIILGARKMQKLESYGFAMTATILAMVPCLSPCCLFGLPVGIWSLVVLNSPEVKYAFRN